MKINIKKRARRLETISEGDILVFPDREEEVSEIDIRGCALYTKRKVENKDTNSIIKPKEFPYKVEFVAYKIREKVFPNSEGSVYDFIKMRKAV